MVLWSKEFMVHYDMEVPKVSYVNLEKPEFDNWCIHHVEPLPGYGISPLKSPASGASSTTSTTSLTSQTSGSKTRQTFFSQHDDLLHEPDFESINETLHDQDEFDSSPSSPFQFSFNSLEPQKLTSFSTLSSSPQ